MSGNLENLLLHGEIWDSTKGNPTYIELIKQSKTEVCAPATDFNDLRANIATYCALLLTLFGGGCNLYRSNFQMLKLLGHPSCTQHEVAYTPEVCRRITWVIIVDTRTYFDDIKLADAFLNDRQILFLVSTLEGDYVTIRHRNKIHCHNYPTE